jgi:hypothetical protein
MRLHLDERSASPFDEGLHCFDVFTNAVCRGLPLHAYENVLSVVAREGPLPVRSIPAREIKLVHTLEISRYRVAGHAHCLLLGRFPVTALLRSNTCERRHDAEVSRDTHRCER